MHKTKKHAVLRLGPALALLASLGTAAAVSAQGWYPDNGGDGGGWGDYPDGGDGDGGDGGWGDGGWGGGDGGGWGGYPGGGGDGGGWGGYPGSGGGSYPMPSTDPDNTDVTLLDPVTDPLLGGDCGLEPTDGTETRTLVYAGADYPRNYQLHVPAGLSGNVPLLISLHDHNSGGSAQEAATGWTAYSSEHNFIVAYPEGNNGAFNPMQFAPDQNFLRELVAQISKDYCVDASRVYIEGLFLGSLMAEKMACDAADIFAAAALVLTAENPDPSQVCSTSRPIAIAVMQPEDDPLAGTMIYGASMEDGAKVRDNWVDRNNCSTTPTPQTNPFGAEGAVYSGCDAGTDVLWRTYSGVGHEYPSGAALEDFRDKTWSFFMAHPRP